MTGGITTQTRRPRTRAGSSPTGAPVSVRTCSRSARCPNDPPRSGRKNDDSSQKTSKVSHGPQPASSPRARASADATNSEASQSTTSAAIRSPQGATEPGPLAGRHSRSPAYSGAGARGGGGALPAAVTLPVAQLRPPSPPRAPRPSSPADPPLSRRGVAPESPG